MNLLGSALGTVGFVGALGAVSYGIIWVWDKAIDKMFGIWNPLEELELDHDEVG